MKAPLDVRERSVLISEEPRVELRAIEAGPESAPRTIVFVHGFGGWKEQWLPQMRRFAPHARVIALDLRGHGASDKPHSAYSVDELLGDLEVAARKLRVKKPFVLVGHSFGAALVASYAAEHPNEIEKLVLISPSSEYSLSPLYRWVFYAPDWLFDGMLRLLNLIRPTFLAPAYVLKALYFHGLRVWRAEDVLPQIQAPTLVLRPRWDPLFPQRLTARVAKLIPSSEEVTLPSFSHVLMTAHPEAVNEALAHFLKFSPCPRP